MTTYIPQFALPHQVFASAPASILLPVTLGAAVGYSTRPKQTTTTYNLMQQPPLRPPPSIFGPVWTLLYGLTGYAAHHAIGGALLSPASLAQSGVARRAAAVYTAQLGLNLAWMPLFFGARRPAVALADIAALLGLNGYLAWLFFTPSAEGGLGDDIAGWCYVPYVAWLAFASYLNFGVGYLNGWDISDETLVRRREARGKKNA
ncbi:putative translocator protein [Eutypa lata UCREL1]|uniref:Putative translocator protein n=1 Tax=Eutypa lata (strain UCR-EL1) TaxID=1287681 RepID=M7TIY0_EUTLA|nr:putative translocator protein [Eutypa lata UCREL1]